MATPNSQAQRRLPHPALGSLSLSSPSIAVLDSDPGICCPYWGAKCPLQFRLEIKGNPTACSTQDGGKGDLGKQHGQCISGGHSGPRMEAKS